MQKKLSKVYLAEAVREILMSVPDSSRDAFTGAECGRRVREEYGDFNADGFGEVWMDVRQHMRLADQHP